MRRLLPLVVIGLVLGLAAPAVAAPPATVTTNFKEITETFIDSAPTCEGDGPLYEITITYNAVEHHTTFQVERGHGVFTFSGTFVGVPLDPSEPGFSGRFASSNGSNVNGTKISSRFIFNLTGVFDDGTKFSTHFSDHFNVTPTGAEIFSRHCHD